MSNAEATTTALLVGRVLARRVRTANRKAAETAEQVEARLSGVDVALEGLTSTDEALEARIASVSGAVEAVKADEQRTYSELRVTDAQVAAIASDIAIIAGRVTANDAIDAAQDAELTGLTGRVEELETRAPVPGPPGPKGDKGPAGPMGRTVYGGGGGSATIQSAGTTIANRPVINFVSGATVADDATNNRVNVAVSGGGGGTINSVSVSSGLSITGTSDLTITNTGVRSLAGSGISVSDSTGAVTITAPTVSAGAGITVAGSGTTSLTVSATGVNSVSGGTGISVSGTTALTVSATGVQSLTAGNGITVSGTTTPTVSASLAAGTGIGISGTTTLSVSNTGVTSIVAGTNVSVSGATGAVTVNAPAFGTPGAVTGGATAASGSASTLARSDHVHSTASMPVLIARQTMTSTTTAITFSSIPQTYTDLHVILLARSSAIGGANEDGYLRFNGDSASNYVYTYGVSALSTYVRLPFITTSSSYLSNVFSVMNFVIPSYSSTSVKKMVLGNTLYQASTATVEVDPWWINAVWNVTTAITSLTFTNATGSGFVAG